MPLVVISLLRFEEQRQMRNGVCPMTSSKQPHPQRCETCENTSCEYHKLKKEIGRARHWQTGKNHTCIRVEFTPASFTEELGCASHSSATEPADPAGDCDTCRFVKECAPLYLPPCYNRGAIRAAQTPEVLESLDKLGEYADSKFEEANLSDNEREMRIHLEYTNRIWGIMKSLRGGATQQGGERR